MPKEIRSLMEAVKTIRPLGMFLKGTEVKVKDVDGNYHGTIPVLPLTDDSLSMINRDIICGNYRIGYIDDEGCFVVVYIGRSDDGLRSRLEKHIDDINASREFDKYQDVELYFWCLSANDKTEAYNRECLDFHAFDDGLAGEGAFQNKIHPDRPDNMKHLHCPVCMTPIE